MAHDGFVQKEDYGVRCSSVVIEVHSGCKKASARRGKGSKRNCRGCEIFDISGVENNKKKKKKKSGNTVIKFE